MRTNLVLQNKILVRDDNGFTLVEVMVGLALSMLSMLIILQLFSVSDARKRVTTGAAEAQQTANVSFYQIGRTIRLGGAGLAQASNVWGCPIQASRGGVQILPAAAAFPAWRALSIPPRPFSICWVCRPRPGTREHPSSLPSLEWRSSSPTTTERSSS